jgi:alanine racemase
VNLQLIPKRTRAEIDLDAVRHNFNSVKSRIGNAKICCVVKANAYGHGAIRLARIYESLGADFLAVSGIEEAMQLRNAAVGLPILILGYTDPACAALLASQNISQCVFSAAYGDALADCAADQGVRVKIHIKLDTGMGRIGFLCGEAQEMLDAVRVCKHPSLIPEGIFTHFSSASDGEAGEEFTRRQFALFEDAVSYFAANGVDFAIRHAANSGAVLDYPTAYLDMVRAGILLYGYPSSDEMRHTLDLKPVLKLKTTVVHIKNIKRGDTVGYGRAFVADHDMTVATLPIGYADGFARSNRLTMPLMEIQGLPAPIVGGICMDQCVIDISDIPNVTVGTSVTVYGEMPFNSIPAVAERNQTIPYEILCSIGERVPRIYLKDGHVVEIVDNLLD